MNICRASPATDELLNEEPQIALASHLRFFGLFYVGCPTLLRHASLMPEIHYRRVQPTDISTVAHLPRKGEAGGDSEERMTRYLAGEHHPQHALPPRAMWIATSGNSPIGYIAGHLTRRFECDGELQWVYVVPAHRRAGVASALLHLLAEWFLEQGARRVCVDVGDDAARPFYRRFGAVELSRHWMVWDDIGALESSVPQKG